MPVKKTIWKMDFFKNDSQDGGAMKSAIEARNHGEVVIHSQTQKNGRLWGSTTPAKLLTLLESNKGLYEVITDFPHKVYFDVDDDKPNRTPLEDIKRQIGSFFPNADFAISGSATEKKTSYHIILNNYLITNETERQTMKQLVKIMCATESAFDWKVYTKNRNMKCINQSKDDGRVQEIMEATDFRKHLITCFFASSLPFPELPEQVALEIKVATAKAPFDLTTLPKMILQQPPDFDFSKATPEEILRLFPLDKSFDHTYTHRIARFCFHSGISFDIFISWLQNKHSPIQPVIPKWQTHWAQLHRFPPLSIKQTQAILRYFYPTITKTNFMKHFENSFILPHDHIQKIDRIAPEHFAVEKKGKIFNIGMGQGKTAQTNMHLKTITDRGDDFIWITPNIALANNTLQRIAQQGVECADYRAFPTWKKRNGILKEQKNLMICANSLHYVSDRTYHTIIVDEPETFFDKWHGDFMDKPAGTKRKNWNVLINIFQHAKSIIFLDAFTTKKSLDFIRNFTDDDYIIYERPEIEITRKVEYIPLHEDKSPSIMLNMIKTDLINNRKVFIFYPYKKPGANRLSMEQLAKDLIKQTEKKGQFYNADQDDEIKAELADVNSAWRDLDFVITNNIITCGINYDQQDFDSCYIFVARFNQARDILQVSARSRYFSTKTVRICFMEKMEQTDTWESDIDSMNHPIYTELVGNILIEKMAPTRDSVHLLCSKAGYKQSTLKKTLLNQLQLEHFQLLEHAESFGSYENIPNITYNQASHIENLMFSQCATMIEKFSLQKFYFDLQFKDAAFTTTIGDEPALQFAWNNQLGGFFEKLQGVLTKKEDSIFAKLATANAYTGIIPPQEIFSRTKRAKIQIPQAVKTAISTAFTFKYQPATNWQLLEKVFNTYFGKHIITTTLTKEEYTTVTIEPHWKACEAFYREHATAVLEDER